MTLLEALKHIQDNGPNDPFYGICMNAKELFNGQHDKDVYPTISRFSAKWPKASKDHCYPVPSVKSDQSPAQCYQYARDYYKGKLWDDHTNYGRLRWELLAFLISELEKEELSESET